MNFLTPTAAAIAAGIAIPTLVILYFLKLRRRDLEVSTTLLWKKSIMDMQANAPFQRLRRNILLFLQLLALAALLFAIAQPVIRGAVLTGSKHVILIDRSGSMNSLDEKDGPKDITRLEAAKLQALAVVDAMGEGDALFGAKKGDQAMVIAFDSEGEPLQPFTSDKRLLRSVIEGITPTDKLSAIDEAMRVALAHLPRKVMIDSTTGNQITLDLIAGEEPVTIHVFSDGRLPDSAKAKPGTENQVVYHRVGDVKAPNLAITGLKAERSFDKPQQVTIFASLMNTQETARSVDVELLVDGAIRAIESATIPAAGDDVVLGTSASATAAATERDAAAATGVDAEGKPKAIMPGTTGVVFKVDNTQGMLAQVRLRDKGTGQAPIENVLATDDRAWIVVPPAKRLSVAIVNRRSMFPRLALEGLPLARLDDFTTAEFERAALEGKAGIYDVVVLDGVIPNLGQQVVGAAAAPAQDGAAATGTATVGTGTANAAGVTRTLPVGNYLVMGVVPSAIGMTDKGATGDVASFIDWSRDHPVTRYLVLDGVVMGSFREVRVDPGSPIVALATAEAGPAILEVSKADTHAIVLPFDYLESTWWREQSFVLFLGAAVDYLGAQVGGRLDARALRPGGELKDRLPLDATRVEIKGPDGVVTPLSPAADGTVLHRLPSGTGVYEVTWDGSLGAGDVREGGGARALRVYAANLLDEQESNVPAAKDLELASTVVAAAGGGNGPTGGNTAQANRRLWPYLILLGLAIVLLEWFVYNRKVHV